jgi:hypothetical protein
MRGATVEVKCKCCKETFTARVADIETIKKIFRNCGLEYV